MKEEKEQRTTANSVVMVSPQGIRTVVHPLVPANSRVQAVAHQLKWKPETVVARVQKALPSVVEQQIYLRLGAEFRIQPESLKKLLREFLGPEELKPEDFFDREVGRNLIVNKFTEVAEFLEGALNLINKVSIEYSGFALSMRSAAVLVNVYGPEGAEKIIDSISARIEEVGARTGGSHRSFDRAMGIAIHFLVNRIMPEMDNHGLPPVLDIMDFFEDIDGLVRYEMDQAKGKDAGYE